MTKSELKAKVEAKIGFHSIIQDELAPDHIPGDKIEKRYLYINHTNSDGTMGKTFIYYLHDIEKNIASFYNVETESLDIKEPQTNQKKLILLQNYLKSNFDGFFIIRVDMENNWAEADVYELSGSELTKSSVMVFKPINGAITHRKII